MRDAVEERDTVDKLDTVGEELKACDKLLLGELFEPLGLTELLASLDVDGEPE